MLERLSNTVATITVVTALALIGKYLNEQSTPYQIYFLLFFIIIFRSKTGFDDSHYFKNRITQSRYSKIGIIAALISWTLVALALWAVPDVRLSAYAMGLAILVSTVWIALDALTQRYKFHPLWVITNCIHMGGLFFLSSFFAGTPIVTASVFAGLTFITMIDWFFSDSLVHVIAESSGADKNDPVS